MQRSARLGTLPFGTARLGFRSFELATHPCILSPEFLDRIGGDFIGATADAPVMPAFPSQYESHAVINHLER